MAVCSFSYLVTVSTLRVLLTLPRRRSNSMPTMLDAAEQRWIEIDLSDLRLPAEMPTLHDLAVAAAYLYERFVEYADDGWQWMSYPGSREFDGWVYAERGGTRILAGARLLSRRAPADPSTSANRPSHGVSPYRTRQLTGTPWTAEPGSKALKSFH
jgi:hypothetical protein